MHRRCPRMGPARLASSVRKNPACFGPCSPAPRIFAPYKEQEEKLKPRPGLLQQFSDNYEIWISYHALLQFKSAFPRKEVDDEDREKIQEEDRIRVGNMVKKQALNFAELALKAAKAEAEAEGV